VVIGEAFRDNAVAMRPLLFFLGRPSSPRLLLPAVMAAVVTFGLAMGAVRAVQRRLGDLPRAEMLAAKGQFAEADAIYRRRFTEAPGVRTAIALIDNHEQGVLRGKLSVDSVDLESLEARLDPVAALVVRYVYLQSALNRDVPAELRAAIIVCAYASPPAPWCNHALGREALKRLDAAEAARRFEREGSAFGERRSDLTRAMHLWMDLDAWDHVRDRLGEPSVAAVVEPGVHYRLAIHDGSVRRAVRWFALAARPHVTLASVAMSAVAALAWGLFCIRLGRIGLQPWRRTALFVLAFVFGILSVIPTGFAIAIEESVMRLVETGDPMRDLLFFVFGVALREEAAKLVMVFPVLLAMRSRRTKLDVIVAGSLVGLGFAAEENLGYLTSGDLHAGLSRFLTANFLHMALTSLGASALDDLLRDKEQYAAEFTQTALMLVALHGAYDFLLSHEEFGGAYLAMSVFLVIVRRFVFAAQRARPHSDTPPTLAQAFVIALAIVTGASACYAVTSAGYTNGLIIMAEGMLGVAILIYAFVRTLSAA